MRWVNKTLHPPAAAPSLSPPSNFKTHCRPERLPQTDEDDDALQTQDAASLQLPLSGVNKPCERKQWRQREEGERGACQLCVDGLGPTSSLLVELLLALLLDLLDDSLIVLLQGYIRTVHAGYTTAVFETSLRTGSGDNDNFLTFLQVFIPHKYLFFPKVFIFSINTSASAVPCEESTRLANVKLRHRVALRGYTKTEDQSNEAKNGPSWPVMYHKN